MMHGIIVGRVAPPSKQGRLITAPELIVGHTADPIHPFADSRMPADELENAEFVRASTGFERRFRPDRLNFRAVDFSLRWWKTPGRDRRAVT
jgi:hypothetical protein